MFELTYRCNFKCKHCYVPEDHKKKVTDELKRSEIFSILDQLCDIGCFYLGFTGGEPFIRKDILDILWYARKKGFQIIIYTNGSLINEKIVEELKRINPNKMDISIPAWSQGVFESISGLSGSREKVFQTIGLLQKNGIKIGLKTCVLKANALEIKDIGNFAHSVGVRYRLDDTLFPCLDGSLRPYENGNWLLNIENFSTCTSSFPETESATQYPTPNTIFKCGAGLRQAAITPSGELKACLMIDRPRFKILDKRVTKSPSHQVTKSKDNFAGAWQKLKSFVSGIKPDDNYQCNRCKLYDYCKWCPARSWLYNKNFTSCEPVCRQKAEKAGIRG
jgi:radical SAM protein with 4Fe4S-binding SPASM domain